MMNIINLADRRNEVAKQRRGEEMGKLCNRLRWFLDCVDSSAGTTLARETLNTASALDFVVAETEREAGKDILRTRRPTFGFIDAPAPVSQEIRKHGVAQSAVIGERVDATLQGSINNGAVALSGGMLCSG